MSIRHYLLFTTVGCLYGVMLWLEPVPAISMAFRQVSANQSQGMGGLSVPLVDVSPVWGLAVSFIPSGELIQQVRVGDPSRVLVDFDSPLGESRQGGSDEQIAGATVIYLRQLGQSLNLNLRLTPQARATDDVPMSVVTLDRQGGRHLHQFRLRLGQDTSYSTVEVVPDLVLAQRRLAALPPRSENAASNIEQIERGLAIAQDQKIVTSDTEMWQRFQQLLTLLRNGQPFNTAVEISGVSPQLLDRVIALSRQNS
jgi:hypothetical protein